MRLKLDKPKDKNDISRAAGQKDKCSFARNFFRCFSRRDVIEILPDKISQNLIQIDRLLCSEFLGWNFGEVLPFQMGKGGPPPPTPPHTHKRDLERQYGTTKSNPSSLVASFLWFLLRSSAICLLAHPTSSAA